MQYCIFNYSYHAVITSPWLICFTRMKAYEFQIWVSRDLTDFPCASWSYRPAMSLQGSRVSLLWGQWASFQSYPPVVSVSPLYIFPSIGLPSGCSHVSEPVWNRQKNHLTISHNCENFFFLSHYILRWLILQQKVTNAPSKEGFPSERFSCKYCLQILFRSHTLCSGLNCVPFHPKCTCLSSF